MEVLSSRILPRPSDLARSQAFYGDVLGLAVYREFGPPERPGVVFFLGNGLLEVSGQSEEPPVGLAVWLQVRNVASEHERLAARKSLLDAGRMGNRVRPSTLTVGRCSDGEIASQVEFDDDELRFGADDIDALTSAVLDAWQRRQESA